MHWLLNWLKVFCFVCIFVLYAFLFCLMMEGTMVYHFINGSALQSIDFAGIFYFIWKKQIVLAIQNWILTSLNPELAKNRVLWQQHEVASYSPAHQVHNLPHSWCFGWGWGIKVALHDCLKMLYFVEKLKMSWFFHHLKLLCVYKYTYKNTWNFLTLYSCHVVYVF